MGRLELATSTVEDMPADEGEASPESRDRLRSRRKREIRARTISVKRMSKRDLYLGRLLYPEDEHADVIRPKKRSDCKDGPRPCPFVACVHHLYLDVSATTGAIKMNFPDLEPHELVESCALDVADQGGATLERVGEILNLTRERVRQLEVGALAKTKAADEMHALRDHVSEGPIGKRRLPVLRDDEEDEDEPETSGDESSDREPGFDVDAFTSEALDAE